MVRKSRHTRAVREHMGTPATTTHLKSTMRSSWVEYYEWIPYTPSGDVGDFHMQVKKGKKYTWEKVTRAQAGQAIGGNAKCTTDDPTGANRWYVDKYPSLGAAYHQICKFFTTAGIAPTSPLPSSAYFDIATEGYTPKYSVDVTKKRGRPTKGETKARDFAWAGRY